MISHEEWLTGIRRAGANELWRKMFGLHLTLCGLYSISGVLQEASNEIASQNLTHAGWAQPLPIQVEDGRRRSRMVD